MNRDIAVTPQQRKTLRAMRADPRVQRYIAAEVRRIRDEWGWSVESVIDMRQEMHIVDQTYQIDVLFFPLMGKEAIRRRHIVNALNRTKERV